MTNNGKEFEELIAAVEGFVHALPGVKIYRDVKLKTHYGSERQIDILIEEERGRFIYKTVIECKNTQSKVTVNTVGAFKELIVSVGAHQGIIVSSSGFQKGALLSAKQANIFLYQLSQMKELEYHLKSERFNIYELSHVSKDFTIYFKEKKEINNELTIYQDLISPRLNRMVSLVQITEHFLNKAKSTVTDSLIREVTELDKCQIIEGQTKIKIEFPEPLILRKETEFTGVVSFESVLQTSFFTAPTTIKNVSEYKDIMSPRTHAFVYEIEFGGEKFNVLKKSV